MKEDKAYIVRKILTIVSLVLIFATAGLLAITTQLKTITLNYYGDIKTVKTLASSVDSFLLQNQIYLNDKATIEPSIDDRVVNGMTINIYDEDSKAFDIEKIRSSYAPVMVCIKEEIETIPFDEEKRDNENMNNGETEVIQEGVEGTKSISYIVKTSNGEVIQKNEVETVVLAEAKNRIVEVGTKVSAASRNGNIQAISAMSTNGFVNYNISLEPDLQEYAYKVCQNYGVDYPLFLAIMWHESRYYPNVSNNGKYIGLCQVDINHMSYLGSQLGISDLYNPYDNMTAGAYLLSYYIKAHGGSIEGGLSSYGGGYSYVPDVLAIRERLIANGGL